MDKKKSNADANADFLKNQPYPYKVRAFKRIFKTLLPTLPRLILGLALVGAATFGLGINYSCSFDNIDPKVNSNPQGVIKNLVESEPFNEVGLYQLLKEALRYHKLQDFQSAIHLYEKILLTLSNSKSTQTTSAKELQELLTLFASNRQLPSSVNGNALVPTVVHYNFAQALYQLYLNTLTEGNPSQPPTSLASSYLARAVYHYAYIIHIPPYSNTYSPLLVKLSSNNLTAIQQRHGLSAFNPEHNITDDINLYLTNLAPIPHLLGVSFLFLISLGMAWVFISKKYPQAASQYGKTNQRNKEIKNLFKNKFKQLWKLVRWENNFTGFANFTKGAKSTLTSETSGFYLDSYDSTANLTSPNLVSSLANPNKSHDPVPLLVKKTIKFIKIWFLICLLFYIGLGLSLWYSSSAFLANQIDNLKNFLTVTSNEPTSAISRNTVFNKLAVVRGETPLRVNPTPSARPLTSLKPGEIVGVKIEATGSPTLSAQSSSLSSPSTIWQPVKTANGVIGWANKAQLFSIKFED